MDLSRPGYCGLVLVFLNDGGSLDVCYRYLTFSIEELSNSIDPIHFWLYRATFIYVWRGWDRLSFNLKLAQTYYSNHIKFDP